MNTIRKFCIALAVLGYLSAAPAHATGRFDFGAYKQCVRTPLVDFPGTIAQAAAATPALSTLYNLVLLAGLGDALSGPGPLTVYAPTNDAFALLPPGLADLLTNPLNQSLLTAVLKYHVSPGKQDPRKPLYPKETATLQGQTVFLDYDDGKGPQINQSTASCQGVRASNGVVWIIDSVLLPQFVPSK